MHTHIIKADVMEDQHQVAQKIAKYNLIALPVVEKETKLRGIITVDDALILCYLLPGKNEFHGCLEDEVIQWILQFSAGFLKTLLS